MQMTCPYGTKNIGDGLELCYTTVGATEKTCTDYAPYINDSCPLGYTCDQKLEWIGDVQKLCYAEGEDKCVTEYAGQRDIQRAVIFLRG